MLAWCGPMKGAKVVLPDGSYLELQDNDKMRFVVKGDDGLRFLRHCDLREVKIVMELPKRKGR